jgi:ELWxxDGT repeat protein
LTNVNGTLFFRAYEPSTGCELWKSDGTAAGTVLVKLFEFWAWPEQLTNVNGTLFFRMYQPETRWELWQSDGTTGGTVLGGRHPCFGTHVASRQRPLTRP